MATGIGVSQQLIEDLRQEIANQRVIAIVGAGASIGAGGGVELAAQAAAATASISTSQSGWASALMTRSVEAGSAPASMRSRTSR